MIANAFETVQNFEKVIAEYSGCKYAVAVDSGSNALFLCCLYCNIRGSEVTIPSRTYPSVPCGIIHAGGKVKFKDCQWSGTYRLEPFPIVDGAKRFTSNMYEKETLHCLSFHAKKHLKIGRGGAILTDDQKAYEWLKVARFDGRHECNLRDDNITCLGWNFYMTPEQAARGLWLMMMMPEHNADLEEVPDYPDLSKVSAYMKEEQ